MPGGFYGMQFNDFYSVSIRALNGGQQAVDTNTMNGLGLGAFDAAGATAYATLEIPITAVASKGSETVQVDVSIANVADGALDSSIVVDYIANPACTIASATFLDLDNTVLNFLSASPHPYLGGTTNINGAFTIRGNVDDSLKSLEVQVLDGGQVVATAELVPAQQSTVYT